MTSIFECSSMYPLNNSVIQSQDDERIRRQIEHETDEWEMSHHFGQDCGNDPHRTLGLLAELATSTPPLIDLNEAPESREIGFMDECYAKGNL